MRWFAISIAAAAIVAPAATASADPAVPPPCTGDLAGAMTWPAGADAPLRCDGGRWLSVDDPYPFSDRWVSDGPSMTLYGGARPNPVIEPGVWTATPLTAGDRCSARQTTVTYGKVDGPPRVDEGGVGQPLRLEVLPRLLTIDMSGDCLWQKQSD
ncbi:hypothetical protein MARA_49030 [Mycolicibacterium arabiense]|uniref:Secreted protein n=1 Tax=Mycolicibacterium arabiense TaxID=1286181 RepID=A0A7I7S609_9MYCO|nr:hypothetical protein [Mycolicibacterium arabiense]MCV7372313.1 hypothetical protein [Mycolicibacterium arabiense]BBY51435.1 hypothetical protein MARA_49030 [Mycolicibacterium arabiense]